MKQKDKQGFTLIEILIVIAIIGMLVGLLLPNFNQLRQEGRDQNRKTGVKAIVEALELYKLNQDPPAYPETIPNLNTGNPWQDGEIIYLKQTPVDPLDESDSTNKFKYRYYRIDSQSYVVGVCLEDSADPEIRTLPAEAELEDETMCIPSNWYYKTEP